MKKIHGFTLIELMVVLMVIAIITAIAFPSYRSYIERKDLAMAKQTALNFSTELEKFKAKNFSYKNFDASYIYPDYVVSTGELYLPINANVSEAKYKLTLVDLPSKKPLDDASALGLHWGIKLERQKESGGVNLKQPKNYDLLITSTGTRCMTRTADVVEDFNGCGESNYENW